MTIAPWLKPTDILGALQAGSHVGLSARQADQRDAEMAQQAELAAAREQQNAQEAAAQLRYHYDALSQARDLAERDDLSKEEALKAARALKTVEDDALAKYREGVLKNQAERNRQSGVANLKSHFNPSGDFFKEVEPGVVKQLFTAPAKPDKPETVPTMSLRVDPTDPTSALMRLKQNDPLINKIWGTNAPPYSGTNSPYFKAPAPAVSPTPPTNDKTPEKEQMPPVGPEKRDLDKATALAFLKAAKGDREKARQLARDAGYSF